MATNNWLVGANDGIWETDANWSLGHDPDSTEDVTVSSGAEDIAPALVIQCLSADFTGYSGELDLTTSGFSVGGMLKFSALMSIIAPTSQLSFIGSGVLTSAGHSFYKVASENPSCDITLGDDLSVFHVLEIDESSLIFAGHTLNWSPEPSSGYLYTKSISWTAGSLLNIVHVDPSESSTYSLYPAEDGVSSWPPIVVNGTSGWILFEFSAVPTFLAQSFTLESGAAYFSSITGLTTIGDMSLNGGIFADNSNLTGVALVVGGNFVTNGVNLNGAGGASLSVVGTNVAHDATITDMDCSGGTALDATDNCVDGGGNTNVNFTPPDTVGPTVTNVTSTHANGTFAAGEVIDVQVVFDESVDVTGTPTLALSFLAGAQLASYLSGTGTDTLVLRITTTDLAETPDLDYVATNSLLLAGGTIKDAAGNDAILTLPEPGATGSLGANKAIAINSVIPGNGTFRKNWHGLKGLGITP